MIDISEIEKLREQTFTSEAAVKIAELAAAVSGTTNRRNGVGGFSSRRTDIFHVNPFLLDIKPGFNCRNFDDQENLDHIHTLAESIAVKGVIKPLMVHMEGDKLFVNDGECRLLATRYAIEHLNAQIDTVPTQVEGRGVNEADRVASQVNHNAGKPLTALELGENVKRLLAFGWNGNKIAKETGIRINRQYQLLELLEVPEEIKDQIKAGEVSPTLARTTVKTFKEEATKTLKKAAKVAKASGRKKVAPRDIEPKEPKEKKMSSHRKESFIIETIRKMFDEATIDPPDPEDGTILVKFNPYEQVFLSEEFKVIQRSLSL